MVSWEKSSPRRRKGRWGEVNLKWEVTEFSFEWLQWPREIPPPMTFNLTPSELPVASGEIDRLGWVGELGEVGEQPQVIRHGQDGRYLGRKLWPAGELKERRLLFFRESGHRWW